VQACKSAATVLSAAMLMAVASGCVDFVEEGVINGLTQAVSDSITDLVNYIVQGVLRSG
jgi:hypothetical protein